MKFFDGVRVSIMGSLTALCFSSCREMKTNDPVQSYKHWSGSLPPSGVKVIHGAYWQSAHWSKEYILYLELQTPTDWMSQFNSQNNLKATNDAAMPSDAPSWFSPGEGAKIFKRIGDDQGSCYFEILSTGKIFIYEIQL
jgi:hypothetical protein